MKLNPPKLLWQPDPATKAGARVTHYMQWLSEQYGLFFSDYDGLWEWSVKDTAAFWQSIWDYFRIKSYAAPRYVHSDDQMPDTRWFEGAQLNYAEHIFQNRTAEYPAMLFQSERQALQAVSWLELEQKVAACASWMKQHGIGVGDRVAAFLPNIPEATIAFLAANAVGAVWSSCSPDFGSSSVIDRFEQIEPKLLFVVDGYQYNGKPFDKQQVVRDIVEKLPTLKKVVLIPYLDPQTQSFLENSVRWEEVEQHPSSGLQFEPVPFQHPIWILYSSGTTGIPKAITHSHGGVLLEHLKYLAFHNDVRAGERFFWYTTTGWMMWNFVQASLLVGATIVLFDGNPVYPDFATLWRLAEEAQLNHFGTSAPYLVACMKNNIIPRNSFDLSTVRSLSSTGAPLPPEAFDWVYEKVKARVWLASMSGGTDVCTAFVGGVPTEPVYRGEIQRRALGCAMFAFDETGKPVIDEVGEMVITKPMPSMPIYFWNDLDKERYKSSYFEMYPGGIWRHGDWLRITARNTLVILGRSDATLNRHGIRIGTAEIYRALHQVKEIKDSLIVNLELEEGQHYMPLFIVLNEGKELNEGLVKKIKTTLRTQYTPRHVPDEIIAVPDIPYTISGKKLEAPVKKILLGIEVDEAANKGAMRNPEALDFFVHFKKRMLL